MKTENTGPVAEGAPEVVTWQMMQAGVDVWLNREGLPDKSINYMCKRIYEAMRALSGSAAPTPDSSQGAVPIAVQGQSVPALSYSIETHGNGWALYQGRDNHHHGMNLCHITEPSSGVLELICDALNAFHSGRAAPAKIEGQIEKDAVAVGAPTTEIDRKDAERYRTVKRLIGMHVGWWQVQIKVTPGAISTKGIEAAFEDDLDSAMQKDQ